MILDISNFVNQLKQMEWLKNSGTITDKYHVLQSIFEAYDDWNQQTIDTWEPHICRLELKTQEAFGDAWIDMVFETVSEAIGNVLWEKWAAFIERCDLQEEMGLDNEMLDFIIRDVSWACVEETFNEPGFFTELLSIYKAGYFPCSWEGSYPDGKPVVL